MAEQEGIAIASGDQVVMRIEAVDVPRFYQAMTCKRGRRNLLTLNFVQSEGDHSLAIALREETDRSHES